GAGAPRGRRDPRASAGSRQTAGGRDHRAGAPGGRSHSLRRARAGDTGARPADARPEGPDGRPRDGYGLTRAWRRAEVEPRSADRGVAGKPGTAELIADFRL